MKTETAVIDKPKTETQTQPERKGIPPKPPVRKIKPNKGGIKNGRKFLY